MAVPATATTCFRSHCVIHLFYFYRRLPPLTLDAHMPPTRLPSLATALAPFASGAFRSTHSRFPAKTATVLPSPTGEGLGVRSNVRQNRQLRMLAYANITARFVSAPYPPLAPAIVTNLERDYALNTRKGRLVVWY